MEVFRPALIGALVLTEVGIWQWRMVIAHRGSRASAMLLGIVGAVLQITAITQVVAGIHDPLSIAGYAVGVGLGVLFGLIAGDRLTPGTIRVTVVSDRPNLAADLWDLGWPATAQRGAGEDGPVTVLFVAINRRDEQRLQRDVRQVAPEAFWSTEDLRDAEVITRGRPSDDGSSRLQTMS
jgi:uncharacterized protein YebE (UPF0316 family)